MMCSWGYSQTWMMIAWYTMSSHGVSGLLSKGLRPSAWASFKVAVSNRQYRDALMWQLMVCVSVTSFRSGGIRVVDLIHAFLVWLSGSWVLVLHNSDFLSGMTASWVQQSMKWEVDEEDFTYKAASITNCLRDTFSLFCPINSLAIGNSYCVISYDWIYIRNLSKITRLALP